MTNTENDIPIYNVLFSEWCQIELSDMSEQKVEQNVIKLYYVEVEAKCTAVK